MEPVVSIIVSCHAACCCSCAPAGPVPWWTQSRAAGSCSSWSARDSTTRWDDVRQWPWRGAALWISRALFLAFVAVTVTGTQLEIKQIHAIHAAASAFKAVLQYLRLRFTVDARSQHGPFTRHAAGVGTIDVPLFRPTHLVAPGIGIKFLGHDSS